MSRTTIPTVDDIEQSILRRLGGVTPAARFVVRRMAEEQYQKQQAIADMLNLMPGKTRTIPAGGK